MPAPSSTTMSSPWNTRRGAQLISRNKRWRQTSSPASPSGASRDGGASVPSMRAKRLARHGNCIGFRKADERQQPEVASAHGKAREGKEGSDIQVMLTGNSGSATH